MRQTALDRRTFEARGLCLKTGLTDRKDDPVNLLSNAIARLRRKQAEWESRIKNENQSDSQSET
ncbi:MAG: hypothetical protein DMF61_26625 [Blastocatellia bacterium AA13]|nr:MAG: hypothetical protein DMF61_26625 [Blastocatellia bacterium AA13]